MPRMHAVILSAMVACASLVLAPRESAAQKSRNIITSEQIENSPQRASDLLSAIRALRPHFLRQPPGVRTLGGGAIGPVVLYVDNHREPDLSALQLIMANRVEQVRYLEPSQAENEFGIGASGGAIVVKLKKAPKDVSADTTKRLETP